MTDARANEINDLVEAFNASHGESLPATYPICEHPTHRFRHNAPLCACGAITAQFAGANPSSASPPAVSETNPTPSPAPNVVTMMVPGGFFAAVDQDVLQRQGGF